MKIAIAATSLALLVSTLGACGEAGGADSSARSPTPDLPAYCATQDGGDDAAFWQLVEESCRVATDGDVDQARALRDALDGLDVEQIADFHRTFVRVNHSLNTKEIAAAADEACLPGMGLGDDLFTDFRSWIIAHGQMAYEWVLENPKSLADFPDIASGCGMGEPFGDAAFEVYLDKTGFSAGNSGLPPL